MSNETGQQRASSQKKVLVLGIDGAEPALLFKEWLPEMPHLQGLLQHSIYGRMHSSIPSSTIVAWNCMLSGKDPSHLNVYSYTYKDEHNETQLTNSRCVKAKRLWKYLDEAGKKSIVLHVPLTYPVEPLNGMMISDFLTPELNEKSTYPASLREEILAKYGKYLFDANVGLAGYKSLDTAELLRVTYEMTKLQLGVAHDLLDSQQWDFFMLVLIGSDRLQHTMWRFTDKTHRRYPGPTEYENAIKDYYKYLDEEIGKLKSRLDEDTYLVIASDHGFTKMDGRINLNDWLIQEGYLVLREDFRNLKVPQKFDFSMVDWTKTKAYALGAYFGRIFFNRKARDNVHGILDEEEVERLQDELITKFKHFTDDGGRLLESLFYKPQDIYSGPYMKESPDLYVYFDTLRWGVNNDVGNEGLYSQKTTKGADDAGHAPIGIFLLYHPSLERQERSLEITQVMPTLMKLLGLPVPEDVKGKAIL